MAIAVGLIGIAAAILMITLSPAPMDLGLEEQIKRNLSGLQRQGFPGWFGYRELEFTANIVMFIPLGALFRLVFPRRRIWLGALLLPMLSVAIEIFQLVFLENRYPSVSDIIANSLGAWIGLFGAAGVHALLRRSLPDSGSGKPAAPTREGAPE